DVGGKGGATDRRPAGLPALSPPAVAGRRVAGLRVEEGRRAAALRDAIGRRERAARHRPQGRPRRHVALLAAGRKGALSIGATPATRGALRRRPEQTTRRNK